MKINRTKNSIKGIFSGYINKSVSLLLPFFVQTIFINTLGIEYLGLNSLFTSILNILNLAELGIGSAISFSMYDAIANDDKEEICALVNLYKKLYKLIGISIFGMGIILIPFINNLCNTSDVPKDINIYIIFIMYLLNTSLSYLLFSYKNSLFNAHQNINIINNIEIFVKIVLSVFQIISLLIFKNYYIYLLLLIISTILKNILLQVFSVKYYPKYIPIGNIEKEKKKYIFKKVKALFCYQIGAAVLTSVDSIVISHYLGLSILGKYNSYYFVITALFGFLQMTSNALIAGVGNSIVTETVDKNYKDFKKLNSLQHFIVCFCAVCLICMYQNFIYLWIGHENMFPFTVVICLTIYFVVWRTLDIVNLYKNAIGMWEYDKYRPLVAAGFNLVTNIILVKIIGIYGVIISTILSICLIIFPWSTHILFSKYFKKGYKEYLIECLRNLIITFSIIVITYFCCSFVGNTTFIDLIIRLIICITLSNILYLVFNSNNDNLIDSIKWTMEKIKLGRLKRIYEKSLPILKITKNISLIIVLIVFLFFKIGIDTEKEYFNNSIEKVNISIDDTILIFEDLYKTSNYDSIFDNDILCYLKKLHDKYDAKFTLFVFYQNKDFSLEDMNDKYKREFIENSDWLKFGFHALSASSNYEIDDNFASDYIKTYNKLVEIVGEKSISKIIRVEKYLLNEKNLSELQMSSYKIDGLLASDSIDRKDYYLSEKDNVELFSKDTFYDIKNDIILYNTDIRLENTFINIISKDQLQDRNLYVFTHEWQLYNDSVKIKLKKICYLTNILNKKYYN